MLIVVSILLVSLGGVTARGGGESEGVWSEGGRALGVFLPLPTEGTAAPHGQVQEGGTQASQQKGFLQFCGGLGPVLRSIGSSCLQRGSVQRSEAHHGGMSTWTFH